MDQEFQHDDDCSTPSLWLLEAAVWDGEEYLDVWGCPECGTISYEVFEHAGWDEETDPGEYRDQLNSKQ